MHHVFISYSRQDVAVVDQIASVLEQLHIPIWIDRRDIPVSVPWFEEVSTGIDAADLFVVCDSPNWRQSQACLLERKAADDSHKNVVSIEIALAPSAVANVIVEAYRSRSPQVWVHTEVTVRSAMWDRGQRHPKALLTGQILRQARQLARQTSSTVTLTALDFIRLSQRRQLTRRLVGWASGVLAICALFSCCGGAGASRFYSDQVAAADAYMEAFISDADDIARSPYDELRAASDRVQAGKAGYLDLVQLTNALDALVPDESYTISGTTLIDFSVAAATESIPVVDERGFSHTGSSSPVAGPSPGTGQPLRALSHSFDGGTAVWSTPNATGVQIGARATNTLPASEYAAVSQDGSVVLTVTGGWATSRRADGGSARVIRLPGNSRYTAALATSTGAVVGNDDGEVVAWRGAGEPGVVWSKRNAGRITAFAASRDDTRFAVGLEHDGSVHILKEQGFAEERNLVVGGRPGPMAFSPNGRFLVVGSGADVALFDLSVGLRLATLSGSVGVVRRLAWSADNSRVWAIVGENRVSGWKWRSGRTLVDDPSRRFVAVVGPTVDGRIVAVDRNGVASVIDPMGVEIIATIATAAREVRSAALTRDGRELALGTSTGVVIRSVNDGLERTIQTDEAAVRLAYSPDGDRLYISCLDDMVRSFDPRDGRLLVAAKIPRVQTISVAVDDQGEVFVADGNGEIHLFDRDLQKSNTLVEGTCGLPIWALAVSGSGNVVVSSGDGAVHLGCMYEAHRTDGGWGRVLHQQPFDVGEQSRAVAITDDAAFAAVGLSDGRIRFWKPDNMLAPGGTYHEFGGEVWGTTFTADRASLVAASRDGTLAILPACPLCISNEELVRRAVGVLDRARRLGLIDQ